jgi:hypothetical protein
MNPTAYVQCLLHMPLSLFPPEEASLPKPLRAAFRRAGASACLFLLYIHRQEVRFLLRNLVRGTPARARNGSLIRGRWAVTRGETGCWLQ